MSVYKSSEVARQLGCSYEKLNYLIRQNKIARPGKDASGDLLWSAKDVEAARAAIAALGPWVRKGAARA
jgi:hypothetical protein